MGLLLVALCALVYVGVRAQAPQAQQPLVIDGGTLIDGNGGAPVANSVVVMQGNRITAVGRKGAVNVPANARVIDATGKWVLPGLWDGQTIYNWYYGELMFKFGVTSNIGIGNSGEIGVAVRDAILHGKLFGPRPFTAVSRIVTQNNNNTGLETTLTPNRSPKSAEETRGSCGRYIAAGADMVIFQDGGLPYEYYVAGFEEAKKTNTPVFTRSYGPGLDPRRAALLGSKDLPHSAGIGMTISKTTPGPGINELDLYADMDDAKAKEIIQVLVQHGTALVPTLKLSYVGYQKRFRALRAGRPQGLERSQFAGLLSPGQGAFWLGGVQQSAGHHGQTPTGIPESPAFPENVLRRGRPRSARRRYQCLEGSRDQPPSRDSGDFRIGHHAHAHDPGRHQVVGRDDQQGQGSGHGRGGQDR